MSRVDIIKKQQDLSYLSWDESARPSGLGGHTLKAREGTGVHAVFYKIPTMRGFEQDKVAFAQLICMRLMDVLGFKHLPFQLVNARIADGSSVWVVKSKSYRGTGESAINLEQFCNLRARQGETPLELCARHGWERQVAECMLVDYLTATRDRDISCFDVIRGGDGSLRLAPIQPRAFSLGNAFPLDMWRRDPAVELGTSNYIGSPSLEENLRFAIDQLGVLERPRGLKRALLANLDDVGLPPIFLEAAWTIIDTRWERYASICDL